MVDDASQDATGAVVERIADPRVVLVRHRRNAGVSVARNTGLARATAPVVALLDHDDELLPGSVAVRLTAFDTDVGVVAGRVEVVGEGGLPRLWPAEDDVGEVTREQLLAANCCPSAAPRSARPRPRRAASIPGSRSRRLRAWLRLVSRARCVFSPTSGTPPPHRRRSSDRTGCTLAFAMLASLVPDRDRAGAGTRPGTRRGGGRPHLVGRTPAAALEPPRRPARSPRARRVNRDWR